MLKSCQYCGRIHDSKYDCGKRPQPRKKKNEVDRFRWSPAWKSKRAEIRERDSHVCQVCIRGLCEPDRQYETDNLSVHHALPIEQAWDKRLDNDNLITLCSKHHEMAESGAIPYNKVKEIIDEQESR